MKNSSLRWLWEVPGKKKLYILILTVAQTLHGASGALYALFLRDIVDSATAQKNDDFWRGIVYTVMCISNRLTATAAHSVHR